MEPGTGLIVLGTAVGSAKLIEKILGPTADYLGGGLRNWTERSIQNVGRILRNAADKLGDRIEQPGAVPPKVVKQILEDGPFCEDEIAADYFGGVVASSRTEVGRDDRGAALISLVGRLTSYQIRTHFFFYQVVRVLFRGSDVNLGVAQGRHQLEVFIPHSAYVTAMEFSYKENPSVVLHHVMFGLIRERLIEDHFQFGPAEHIKQHYSGAEESGLLFSPSALGVELFLWAHGRGDLVLNQILDPAAPLQSSVCITTTVGIKSTKIPDRELSRPKAE